MEKDIFDTKNIAPMLLQECPPFNNKDYIFELKLDGIRCLAYLDKNTSLRNKRDKELIDIYPELKDLHKQVKNKCILDGELVVMRNCEPDFFSLQKRALLSDKFKIKLASKKLPVQFVAYDIIYLKNELICEKTLIERKMILKNTVKENKNISLSRYIDEFGVPFFELAKKKNLEGIVAKRKDSIYQIGKRSYNWLKIKVMHDDDFLICGIVLKENGEIKDILLCKMNNGIFKYYGSVSLGIGKTESGIIKKYVKNNKKSPFFNKSNAIFCEPKLVCTVKYMEITKKGSLRQSIFKGLKDDKLWL